MKCLRILQTRESILMLLTFFVRFDRMMADAIPESGNYMTKAGSAGDRFMELFRIIL
jgi:hypothetical protein